jgi:hypothetical protein
LGSSSIPRALFKLALAAVPGLGAGYIYTLNYCTVDIGRRVAALNVYTRQNLRRHGVLKKTSQMRTICTQIGRFCLFIYPSASASFLGVTHFCRYVFYLIKENQSYGVWLCNKFIILKSTEINHPEEC